MYAERLRGAYPRVRVDPDVLYIADERVMTSAGTAAGIDLCLHLVALDHGVDVAAAVARRLVMPLYRSGGQAQYVDTPIAPDPGDGSARCSTGARRTSTQASPWTTSSAAAAMSPRTLTRRFRAAVGMPPGEWLHRERLRLAQRLLERTDDPIERGRASGRLRRGGHYARAVRGAPADLAARVPADVPRLTGCGPGSLSQAAGSSARRSSSVSASAASLSVRYRFTRANRRAIPPG